MNKKEILSVLDEYRRGPGMEYGILSLGLFGSVAREVAGAESDIDIVVSLSAPDLFALAGIKADLEERMHRPVDLVVYRERMNNFLKQKIDQDAVYV